MAGTVWRHIALFDQVLCYTAVEVSEEGKMQGVQTAELGQMIINHADKMFLGLAPFLRLSIEYGDLRFVAQSLLARAGEDYDNAALWMNLATAFFCVGERQLGLNIQEQGLLLARQFDLPANEQPARCRVLMLVAPGDLAENTPLDCLLETTCIDLVLYYASPDQPLPVEIPPHDALLVGMSDSAANRPVLRALEQILADWDRPVVNRPSCIPNVERHAASLLLRDAPGVLMPLTHLVDRHRLEAVAHGRAALADMAPDCRFPIILRPVGSQAGRDLEKIDDAAAILPYLDAASGLDFYLSRFIDYRSADGLFRKYRVALVAGEPFACHMAISSHWMIHYVNAGMLVDEGKRKEEAAFMAEFDAFARRHRAALEAVATRCGLDYVAIDCAESPAGELLIFEVDHVMVIHAMDPPDMFPHKQETMAKVRRAVEELFCRLKARQTLPN
ncbi:MAG: hypothetical protein FWD62_11845 [Betaproteobacteria bacterium]|nr:hypothetical protein [Betaproteobacteria bacterium]